MDRETSPADNYDLTRRLVGYLPLDSTTPETYRQLGFKSGLEIHQQLKTTSKLFCRCPAGLYQKDGAYDAEVIRHMRPTLSEMGEYDGTALMERKTRKNIVYRIKNETACTYDIDDTPPFTLDPEALEITIKLALMLKLSIVGEFHITRKQYLDGSIPTGFQRTGIVGIEGKIPVGDREIGIIQMSLEEDSCREVSDKGHWRVYTTDRLGMPLVETVTYPDMKTPDEVAEVAHHLRYLVRSSGRVRTGIGAARQDVNVSIEGGTRVEIKGVSHIRWIPALVHTEAFRQKALLLIRDDLKKRITDPSKWEVSCANFDWKEIAHDYEPLRTAQQAKQRLTAILLPDFRNILSFFTQPGQSFANELSGRLKVVACLEQPNMLHSEQPTPGSSNFWLPLARERLKATDRDAIVLVWGPPEDVKTAIETIEERCRMAFDGVPSETRKALADGTTIFERVLPGPNRMYPDTDSAPIPIREHLIEHCAKDLPMAIHARIQQLENWRIPADAYPYILRNNLNDLIERIVSHCGMDARFIGCLLGHTFKHWQSQTDNAGTVSFERIYELCSFVAARKLDHGILPALVAAICAHPVLDNDLLLAKVGYESCSREGIISLVPKLHEQFDRIRTSPDPSARVRWIMGTLRRQALGNISLSELRSLVDEMVTHV